MPHIGTLSATLGEQVVAQLSKKYTTVEEFLIVRNQDPSAHLGDPALAHAEEILGHWVASCLAPSPLDALVLQNELRDNTRILPTGCDSIDLLLGGGVFEGRVTEIAGESASGKTQVCHMVAALSASRGEGVIWVDTTNSFSPTRLQQLSESMQPGTSGAPLLDHIQVACPHTLHQLSAVLEHVALMCEEHNKEAAAQGEPTPEAPLPASSPCPSLVVIDSVSAVVGPVLGMPQHGQGYTALASLGRQLRHLAQAHRLAVLVTNHVVASRTWEDKDGGGEPQQRAQPRRQAAQGGGAASAGGGRQLVPAMGESWRSQVHVRLTLALTPEGPEGPRRASLFTGAMERGAAELFSIASTGLPRAAA